MSGAATSSPSAASCSTTRSTSLTSSGSSAGDLVARQHRRPHGERACDRDALLLAAGQLARVAVELVGEFDLGEQRLRQVLRLARRPLVDHRRRQHHVLAGRQMRKQVELLEHHADVAAQLAHIRLAVADLHAVDHDRTGLVGLEPVDAAQQRALARPRPADDGDDVAAPDIGRDALQHLVGAKALANLRDLNERLRHRSSLRGIWRTRTAESTG